ncbi:hypothetical protein AC578_6596 [Pseudocercospora eumusae]|nr:hypothetical protein AC578_6596 [Pseudocercospora eumusae]
MSPKDSRSSGEDIELQSIGFRLRHGQQLDPPPDLSARYHRAQQKTPAQLSDEIKRLGLDGKTQAEAIEHIQGLRSKPLSAQYTLQSFVQRPSDHTPRPELSQEAKEESRQRIKDEKILEKVRKCGSEQGSGLLAYLRKARITPPDIDCLKSVVAHAFPPRMQLPVLVCDVYADKGTITCSPLGDIERLWKAKPEGAIMRWIHAPVGQGLMHSSIEDIFRHDWEVGRSFPEAGGPGFPYLELDLMHFREREALRHQREVYKLLHDKPELSKELTEHALDGDNNPNFQADLTWREIHRAKTRSYWDLTTPDIPLELSEHLAFHSHDGPLRPLGLIGEMDKTVLAYKCEQFREAQTVIAPFRCFHRADNILLTMSAATGVDQLHKHFDIDIKETLLNRLLSPQASIVGNMMHWLKDKGASQWYDHSIEWFLVFLISELGIAPNNMISGRAGSSVLSALQCAVQDLKNRRFQPWKRDETVKLVKEFISCLDELKLLSLSCRRKLKFFEGLQKDLKNHETEDQKRRRLPVNNATADTALQRAQWATSVLKDERDSLDYLYEDVTQALSALFQLRSIEQNDRAIATEVQNRAILIFTSVTVIFMPISVFTSYYGMNLVDIRNSTRTQRDFWASFGSAAIAIVVLVGLVVRIRYIFLWPANYLQQRRRALRSSKGDGGVA